MSRDGIRVGAVLLSLAVLQFVFIPMLGWRANADCALVAAVVAAVRVRPGIAAIIGFAIGLSIDARTPDLLGTSALALACIAFVASFLRAGFFSERPVLNVFLFFAGKWFHDLLVLAVQGGVVEGGPVGQLLIWSPLAAMLTAAVGIVAMGLSRPRVGGRR